MQWISEIVFHRGSFLTAILLLSYQTPALAIEMPFANQAVPRSAAAILLGRWQNPDDGTLYEITHRHERLVMSIEWKGRYVSGPIFPFRKNGDLYVIARITDDLVTRLAGFKLSHIGKRRCYHIMKFKPVGDRDLEITHVDEMLTLSANPDVGIGSLDSNGTCPLAFLNRLSPKQQKALSLLTDEEPTSIAHLHRIGPPPKPKH